MEAVTEQMFYSRVRVSAQLLARLLQRDGNPVRVEPGSGVGELVFHVYASTREEALPLVHDIEALASELHGHARDLRAHINTYYDQEEAR